MTLLFSGDHVCQTPVLEQAAAQHTWLARAEGWCRTVTVGAIWRCDSCELKFLLDSSGAWIELCREAQG